MKRFENKIAIDYNLEKRGPDAGKFTASIFRD
jgi:hypothetical protein